jgi:hypothetical protein
VTPEQLSSQVVRLSASSLGMKLFRNNSGAFKDETGRLVRFGLGNESKKLNDLYKFGDYIGTTPVTITQDMVGKTVAVFTNLEVKPDGDRGKTLLKAMNTPNSREAAQLRAIELTREFGGIGGFVTNADEVNTLFKAFLQDLRA